LPLEDKSGAALPSKEEGLAFIRRNCTTDADAAIFSSFFLFNRSVLKTNLYRPHKTALSFRLDPSFLPASDYPDKPYGVFFIVGSGEAHQLPCWSGVVSVWG
jgi:glutamate dehydrogenase